MAFNLKIFQKSMSTSKHSRIAWNETFWSEIQLKLFNISKWPPTPSPFYQILTKITCTCPPLLDSWEIPWIKSLVKWKSNHYKCIFKNLSKVRWKIFIQRQYSWFWFCQTRTYLIFKDHKHITCSQKQAFVIKQPLCFRDGVDRGRVRNWKLRVPYRSTFISYNF